MKTWMLPLVLMSFAFSSMAYAAGNSDHSGGKANRMDEKAMSGPTFEEMDANGDGKISADELNVYGSSAAGQSHGKAMEEHRLMKMHEMDLDGDGNISNDEFEKGMMSK